MCQCFWVTLYIQRWSGDGQRSQRGAALWCRTHAVMFYRPMGAARMLCANDGQPVGQLVNVVIA